MIGPKFDRLAQVLDRDPAGLELRADPTALAPERLLVFEVRGDIQGFVEATKKVPGLEFIDEEALEGSDGDDKPVAYLIVPDAQALRELLSLWKRWQRGEIGRGETPWRHIFDKLRDLRPWGPSDRVDPADTSILSAEIEGRDDEEAIRIEVELVYRANERTGADQEAQVSAEIAARGGRTVSRARIDDIGYHALLVDLPVRAVRDVVAHGPDGIAGIDPVMHIRPQAIATTIEVAEQAAGVPPPPGEPAGAPILALLDGVPVQAHPALANHVILDDQFGLEPAAQVAERVHGTAMASLIIHGDRNRPEAPLPRPIHIVPVLGQGDRFPTDRLVVDVIAGAVLAMREGAGATAPDVLIVNISLGNARRQFYGQMSAWARLLDRLAYRFGILFLVSAGNILDEFSIPAFANRIEFEDADAALRSKATLEGIDAVKRHRRLLAPAETVNGLTIGASNDDAVTLADRVLARVNVDPYSDRRTANPSSALGPGFGASVKPDLLMPGSREHLRVVANHTCIDVGPARPSRAAGLLVAAPPSASGRSFGYTSGTSAATALASRTAHRIHDALASAYPEEFGRLSQLQRAALIKALLVHPARWPDETAALIKATIGPADGRKHVAQKDNIRRYLGFGFVDADEAIACADDRATFWAVGELGPELTTTVHVPVPLAIGGQTRPHSISATLAWITPVFPGRKTYRSVRLKLLEPTGLGDLRIEPRKEQPDRNQANRGTVFTRCWEGEHAPVVAPGATFDLVVQRDLDQGAVIDEAVPFGLAITLTMPGIITIYDEVRARVGIAPRIPA